MTNPKPDSRAESVVKLDVPERLRTGKVYETLQEQTVSRQERAESGPKDYYCTHCKTEMTRADARSHDCRASAPTPEPPRCAECGLPDGVIAHHPASDKTPMTSGEFYHPFAATPSPDTELSAELQTAANDLLRDLNREIFGDHIDILKLPQAVGMCEDFAEAYARQRLQDTERELEIVEHNYKILEQCAADLAKKRNAELTAAQAELRTMREAAEKPILSLLKVAARIARREHFPSLEKCKTIAHARQEVQRYDDYQGTLAMDLKSVHEEITAALRTQGGDK